MKKIISIITLFTVISKIFTYSSVSAATPTLSPTKSATPSATTVEEEQTTIRKIKEMVANKVAKLNLVEKRGILGTVKDVSNTQITIIDDFKKQRFIDIDELTKFQESIGSSKTFGISDVESGDVLGFIGTYNKDTRRLLARFITKTASIPKHYSGVISDINSKNYSITMLLSDKNKKIIDIETSTKTRVWGTGDDDIQKSGFSKLEIGQRVLVVGFDNEDEKDRVAAQRILHFTDLPPEKGLTDLTTTKGSPSPTAKKSPTPKIGN